MYPKSNSHQALPLSRRKALLGAAGAAVAVAAGASFGRGASADMPKKGGHLKMGLSGAGATNSLDPATFDATYMNDAGFELFNTLIEINEQNRPQPSLATAWEPAEGGAKWIFKVRKGVSFHNGKEMTASDVVYSLNRHRGTDSKSGAKAYLEPVTDVVKSDQYEVTIALSGANADFPQILSDYHLCIQAEGEPADKGVGTGAFVLENFEPGVRMLATKNPRYWNPDRGHVDSVETLAINDAGARLSALQSGAVHLINQIDPKVAPLVEKDRRFQLYNSPGGGFDCFAVRCDTAPYSDANLRLALKYAIDREEFIKRIMGGYATVANDQPVAPYDIFYAKDLPQRPYDPDKAKFYMKKSGFDGELVLSASDVAFQGAVDAAQVFQANALKAGINIKVERASADGFWSDTWMKKPFITSGWGFRPTADAMLSIAFQSSAPWNETFWKRPDFDKMLLAARADLDPDRRRQMYHDMQQMIVDDGGEIIPAFVNLLSAGSAAVKGYTPATLDMSGHRAAEKVWLDA